MQLDALRFREIFLFQLELGRKIEQSDFLLLLRKHFVQKRQMVPEETDAGSIVDRHAFPNIVLVEDRGHGRDILMAEA